MDLIPATWPRRMNGLRPTLLTTTRPHPPLPPGPSGFKQLVTTYRTAFPDIHLTIDDWVVEGDKVAGRWTARGTNTGPLMGMPPTGKSATVTGISILTFANDQVTAQHTNWDAMGMLQQLGVIPTPGV